MQASAPAIQPDPAQTLSKAVVRAASLLDLTQSATAEMLGISTASASRLFAGTYQLQRGRGKEWQLAILFVRLFRSLDAITGQGEAARAWLRSPNRALGAIPRDLIGEPEGLVRVVHYLDAHRGHV